MVFMIEKLLALAPKSTNRQLHFFVPFNFGVYLFLSVLQILIKIQNTYHMEEGECEGGVQGFGRNSCQAWIQHQH